MIYFTRALFRVYVRVFLQMNANQSTGMAGNAFSDLRSIEWKEGEKRAGWRVLINDFLNIFIVERKWLLRGSIVQIENSNTKEGGEEKNTIEPAVIEIEL